MLAQRRGRGPDARRRMRVFDGRVDEFHGTAGGVLDFLDHVAGEDCWVECGGLVLDFLWGGNLGGAKSV